MLKEVDFAEISKYKDPLKLFDEGCVALAENSEKANPITIGWGALGTLWSRPICTVYIHKKRFSKKIFDEAKFFSVCFLPKEYDKISLGYFGTATGRNEDKIAKSGLTLLHESEVFYFGESELVIICKKVGQTDFNTEQVPEGHYRDWYKKEGPHTIYCGEIIKVLKKY